MIFVVVFSAKLVQICIGEKLDCHTTSQIQQDQTEILIALSEKVIISLL